ncbi:hypothetical protein K1719_016282 [Acacia pycnantha]|nr:hypothetical protein K1719_016282 [Acacia pycnantha]
MAAYYSIWGVFEDHRTFGSPSAANTRESLWRSLEEEIIPSFSNTKSNWLELQSKLISKEYRESNVCVIGEAVKVNVEFKNPLQIPIPVSGVTLICKHFPSTVEVKSDENISRRENDNAGKCEELTACRDMSSENSFMASEVDFLLRGGETTMVSS